MVKYRCECQYCGYVWTHDPPSYMFRNPLENLRCTNGSCNDKNIKVRELSPSGMDVFGYRFSPPFEKKVEEEADYHRYTGTQTKGA